MQDELIEQLAQFVHDPYGHVMFCYPWGEEGTELENETGPEDWQRDLLIAIGNGLLTIDEAICIAVTSGHGVGKSAFVSWLILWAISTFEDTVGVITANTETQLKTKTWAQLSKWHRLFIAKDLFELTATKICSKDPAHENSWRVDMVPWSVRNTEAFAGLHNKGKRILLVFDEASAIPEMIWEVSRGALTDKGTEIIWAVFGNPTKNTGAFRDCFPGGRFSHRWKTTKVDSRAVTITNKEQIAEWEADYGEDSDFFRVRVKGEFPRTDSGSFIPLDLATMASSRTPEPSADALVLGVDVGRFGDDPSVIFFRRGNDAVSIMPEVYFGLDTQAFAVKVALALQTYGAAVAMVDGGGVGGGVVDRLRVLQVPVMEVSFGGGADAVDLNDGTHYANKRAEIWGKMRHWLARGSIPLRVRGLEMTMVDELIAPEYSLTNYKTGEAILLESKKDMRARGIKSPNLADALACTFAYPVIPRRLDTMAPAPEPDYNPYDQKRMLQ